VNKFTRKHEIAQVAKHKQDLMNGNGDISLNGILLSQACQEILNECRIFRERIYTPIKTVFMFVKQVLSADTSCRNAVAGAVTEQMCSGEDESSINTGPYCKARQRLPEKSMHDMVKNTGKDTVSKAPESWRWNGRPVKLVDGTTVTMADTAENQKEFPQHGNQKEGVGFPIARLVAIMSLETGAVLDYAIAAHKGKGTGEHSLYREIVSCIEAGDVLLGDRYYPSFFY